MCDKLRSVEVCKNHAAVSTPLSLSPVAIHTLNSRIVYNDEQFVLTDEDATPQLGSRWHIETTRCCVDAGVNGNLKCQKVKGWLDP